MSGVVLFVGLAILGAGPRFVGLVVKVVTDDLLAGAGGVNGKLAGIGVAMRCRRTPEERTQRRGRERRPLRNGGGVTSAIKAAIHCRVEVPGRRCPEQLRAKDSESLCLRAIQGGRQVGDESIPFEQR